MIENMSWMEKANCQGMAHELFEYQEKDSPLCAGMKYTDRVNFNGANFQLAEEICIECPVMLICEEKATPEQRYWTVRGGNAPGRFDEESKRYENVGRPPGSKNKKPRAVAAPGDRVCKRDHVVKGGGRCKTCKHENNVIRQRRVRAEARAKAKGDVQ